MSYPIANLSVAQLRKAAAVKERIEKLEKELAQILGSAASEKSAAPAARSRKKRKMTSEGRARIRAAAKARWAKWRADKK